MTNTVVDTIEDHTMNTTTSPITAVPTNIITGFLGVGKTSAILHLLKHKPDNERWAVLVNEFGEIGVDGSLFEGKHGEESGVFIREVPGGCMCCAAGLPMQIALNQLLSRAKPDRLLIEPTGLGHPKEVLQVLSGQYNRDLLLLQKIITLVDARKLCDERYTSHDTFNQQIAIADIIVGNKVDLYPKDGKEALKHYMLSHARSGAEIVFTEHGEISPELLQGATSTQADQPADHHHHHTAQQTVPASQLPIPDCGYIKATNQGEGFNSVGWRFSPDKVFSYNKLFAVLTGLHAERMKAVFITDDGLFGYNLTPDALTELPLDECLESRVEVISDQPNTDLEAQLLDCLTQ